MFDNFQREINYLRVSVTDKCNLRCKYCMPEEGVPLTDHQELLRHEEIVKIIRASTRIGIKKVRLTGGEPLVRRGIVELIRQINALPEIDDIALTTNGIFLPELADEIKEAGLKRVNISLDTLREDKFKEITRGGSFKEAWAGLETALMKRFHPVKLNMVVMKGFNDDEILEFARLSIKMPIHVRFIELMPIGVSDVLAGNLRVSVAEIKEKLWAIGKLIPEKKISGSGPARYYKFKGAMGTVGFINAISSHFCASCNRLRLTPDGKLRTCLHSSEEVDLKTPLRKGAAEDELVFIMKNAVLLKPKGHTMRDDGWKDNGRMMSQIGG